MTQFNPNPAAPYEGAERRAATRRRFHKPVEVQLSGTTGDQCWSCAGTMLNATVRGVACRIPAEAASGIPMDDRLLTAAFDLGEGSGKFALPARVRNATAAGTPDHIVVGVEFEFNGDSPAEKLRLGEALDALSTERGRGRTQ